MRFLNIGSAVFKMVSKLYWVAQVYFKFIAFCAGLVEQIQYILLAPFKLIVLNKLQMHQFGKFYRFSVHGNENTCPLQFVTFSLDIQTKKKTKCLDCNVKSNWTFVIFENLSVRGKIFTVTNHSWTNRQSVQFYE